MALAYREAGRAAEASTVLDELRATTAPDHALAALIGEASNARPPQ